MRYRVQGVNSAMSRDGGIVRRVSLAQSGDPSRVVVQIIDSGDGCIPSEVKPGDLLELPEAVRIDPGSS